MLHRSAKSAKLNPMSHPHIETSSPGSMTGFLREASARLGISPEKLETAVRAAQVLSNEELEVVEELLHLADAGIPQKRRSAMSRGVVKALEAVPGESALDPLAEVDEPMDTAAAAEALSFAEVEAQTAREAILRDCVSVAEAARRTGRSRQALERLRRAGRLVALRVGNQWRYPVWQFDLDASGGIVPGLEEILRHLALSPVGAAFWLLQPSERLDGARPIDLLRRRRPEPVIALAREAGTLP